MYHWKIGPPISGTRKMIRKITFAAWKSKPSAPLLSRRKKTSGPTKGSTAAGNLNCARGGAWRGDGGERHRGASGGSAAQGGGMRALQ